jgi:hypothetical protein
MTVKGRIFGFVLLVLGFYMLTMAFRINNVGMGVIAIVMLLMGIGKGIKGY